MDKNYIPTIKEMEEILICSALNQTAGNKTHAARILGLSVRGLRNKINTINDRQKKALVPAVRHQQYNTPEIRGDNEALDCMKGILHGPLRKLYFEFLKADKTINQNLQLAYGRLLKMTGTKRAEKLRKDSRLREYYAEKTQRV